MNIPKLRFPSYNKEYQLLLLGDYLIQYKKITEVNNQYPVLTSSRQGIFFQEDYFNRQVASTDNTGYNIVPRNYFTYRHMSDDAIFSFNINNLCEYGIVSTLYPVFTTTDLMDSNYLKYYLNYSRRFKEYCLLQKQGGSRTYMYFDKLKKFEGCFPELEEQKKVSHFLEFVDRKIDLHKEKLNKIISLKLALLNETIDRIDNYEEISLRDLGSTYTGLSGKTKDDFENGNCKFINFMSVLKDNIDVNTMTCVKIGSDENQNKVKKGDLFFTTSSENREEVALCSTLNSDVENLYLNSFCFGYRINDLNKINNEYLNCLLHSSKYRKQISNLGQGFTRVNISKTKLLELLIIVPNMKKQLEIVNLNNSLNKRIYLESEKLDKLEQIKKGLMQNMFV